MRTGLPCAICLALATGLLSAAKGDEPRYLEVQAQGYSRFEIADGNVVAVFPEPVRFKYLGYEVNAGNLRYDQSTEIAEAGGGVFAVSEEYSFEAPAVVFDGRAGHVGANGGIRGSSSEFGYSIEANEAALSFPPESRDVGLTNMTVVCRGNVRIQDEKGGYVICGEARFSGANREINIPGVFRGLYLPPKPLDVGKESESLDRFEFSGADLSGSLDEENLLVAVAFNGPVLHGGSAHFCGDRASAARRDESTGSESWSFEIDGSPVVGQLSEGGEEYTFESSGLTGDVYSGEEMRLVVSGDTTIWMTNGILRCSSAVITRGGEGFAIELLDGLVADSNLAAISGTDPVSIESISNARKD
jgi:hypothetical protein